MASALRAGDAAFSRSEFIAAVRHFSEAIDVDASSAMLLHKRAAAHISLGDHAAGARDLSAALDLEPESIQVLLQRSASRPVTGPTSALLASEDMSRLSFHPRPSLSLPC